MKLTNLGKVVLARARHHQGRPAAVLRRRRAGAAAAHARPRDGDEALSERRRRRVLLHEARADAAPGRGSRPARSSTPPATSSTFPMIQDLAALLWVINLGCIDLNQWYARCDDVDRPDYLHFDLDPGERGRASPQVRGDRARRERDARSALGMPTYVEDDRLARPPRLRADRARPDAEAGVEVAKTIALDIARRHPRLLTAVYRKAARPRGRVLVDYNQNAWGRTLASVYSVRPRPRATRLDAGHVGRGRARRRDRGLPHRQRPRPRRESSAISGRPSTDPRGRFDLSPALQTTAIASTSISQSGCASAETWTSVEAGPFLPRNSSRIGTRSAR